ncbi:hypothetical protein XCR_1553 [Xanthomonas campestris pv. raphani 756C]|nr:hypothetical protein XCR_1553 [Xanthomonas campestris pv. raphani 756C]
MLPTSRPRVLPNAYLCARNRTAPLPLLFAQLNAATRH